MSRLDRSIKKTISYAGYFNFPMSTQDIYLWLISPNRVPLSKIKSTQDQILTKKEAEFRLERNNISKSKILGSANIIKLISRLPFVLLIAVTGSVAVNNSKIDDDIDLMIVTRDHCLWLTRAIITVVVSLFGRRRHPNSSYEAANNTLCLNLWLEERSLKIPGSKHNLYTAHEVLQTLPVFDRSAHHLDFLQINRWTKKYLANAYYEKTKNTSKPYLKKGNRIELINLFIIPINYLLFLVQFSYMKPKITSEIISLRHAYFHKVNFAQKIKKHLELF